MSQYEKHIETLSIIKSQAEQACTYFLIRFKRRVADANYERIMRVDKQYRDAARQAGIVRGGMQPDSPSPDRDDKAPATTAAPGRAAVLLRFRVGYCAFSGPGKRIRP